MIHVDITERIRGLREDHEYSQTYVAGRLHIAQTSYSDYETGKVRIPVSHLIELARLYDVDLNYISGLSNQMRPFPRK